MSNVNIAGYKVKYHPNNDKEVVATSVLMQTKELCLKWVAGHLKPGTDFKIVPYYVGSDYEHY